MGIHIIKNMIETIISNLPLQSSKKRLTNHSARKTLAKASKRNQVYKSEIISTTYSESNLSFLNQFQHQNNLPITSTINMFR